MKSIKVELDEYMMAVLGILAGGLLVVFPEQSINILTYAIGIMSLVYGVVKIVSYFRNREMSYLFVMEMILGIILVGIGIFSFVNPGGIFAVLPIILGILVIIEGVSKIQRAKWLREYGSPKWKIILLVGLLIGILGIVLVVNPFNALVLTVRIMGAVMLADGVAGLWVGFMLNKFSREE